MMRRLLAGASLHCDMIICMTRRHFVYILECADTTLYVGCTNDLEKRVRQHNGAKSGAHYTKIRRPVVLKYSETFKTLGKARAREAEIKRWPRKEKMQLIDAGGGVIKYAILPSEESFDMAKGNNSQRKEAKKPKKDKKKK